jgi:hypothetical protein
MRQTPPISSEIVWLGRARIWTLPAIAALVRNGLTPHDCETLALVAHGHGLTVAALMALALEAER